MIGIGPEFRRSRRPPHNAPATLAGHANGEPETLQVAAVTPVADDDVGCGDGVLPGNGCGMPETNCEVSTSSG